MWWYVLRMITQEQAETRDEQDLTGWPCAPRPGTHRHTGMLDPEVLDLDLALSGRAKGGFHGESRRMIDLQEAWALSPGLAG